MLLIAQYLPFLAVKRKKRTSADKPKQHLANETKHPPPQSINRNAGSHPEPDARPDPRASDNQLYMSDISKRNLHCLSI